MKEHKPQALNLCLDILEYQKIKVNKLSSLFHDWRSQHTVNDLNMEHHLGYIIYNSSTSTPDYIIMKATLCLDWDQAITWNFLNVHK